MNEYNIINQLTLSIYIAHEMGSKESDKYDLFVSITAKSNDLNFIIK